MTGVTDASVHLVVTSPPYPMIEMWDDAFSALDPAVAGLLAAERGWDAFEAQHAALDAVWAEVARVLVPGGFACVNVGDATRTLGSEFALYPNHARITTAMLRLGMTPLPDILWRKPTNAPNKFMGSGMLPAGAYVTYEHEYVLIFRKGGKRAFSAEDKARRAASAFFWEERNAWFSDVWTELRGTGQQLAADGPRERSAAFPFELPWRLVHMYALQGDTVLDPFAGTGTTMAAALAAGRSSVGFERLPAFAGLVAEQLGRAVDLGRRRAAGRLAAHVAFVQARVEAGKAPGHTSRAYGFPVVTNQETELRLLVPRSLRERDGAWVAEHEEAAWEGSAEGAGMAPEKPAAAELPATPEKPAAPAQATLFPRRP